MLEVVAVIAAPRERIDKRRLQGLIQGAKKALFPCVRQYRRHNPKLELASDDGGNDEDLIGERRQPAQSLTDGRAHVLGDRARLSGLQPRDLRHEERVPAGSRVDQLDHLLRRLLAGDTRHELPRVFRGQPTQCDPGHAHARELAERLRERRPNLALPIGGHDQHGVAGKLLGDELEEQQRVLIRPMKILENKQNWRLQRGTLQKRVHGVEELEPVRLNLRCGRNAKPLAYLRDDEAEATSRGTEDATKRRDAAALGKRADDLCPRPVRRRRLALYAAPPEYAHGSGGRDGGELLDQPGLANAGLATDQHDLSVAALRFFERATQHRQLALPADEHAARWCVPHSLPLPSSTGTGRQ